jgi:hypothetical protein
MLVQVPFNNLPEEARERLAMTLLDRARDPSAVSDTGRGLFWMGWILVGAGLLGLSWRVFYGFGVPWESAAIHGPAVTVEFLIYGALIGVPLPWLLVRQIRRRACPFPPGRYLLAADYIDARDPILHIVPIQEARTIQIARSNSIARLTLSFDGPSGGLVREVFTVRGKDRIEHAIEGFMDAQKAHEKALAEGDLTALAKMDPLYSVRVGGWAALRSGEVDPESSFRVRPIPWWTRGMILWFPIAIGFGSLMLASVRDRLSDAMVFELLLEEDSTAAWSWYLDQDGARSGEVIKEHLPRAEDAEHDLAFAECQEQVSVSCWNAWLSEYGSIDRYQDSVRRVERELKPRAALDEALAAGSVAALREYQESVKSGAGAAYTAEARKEIADSIADARTALLSQLIDDPELVAVFTGIMGWLEVQGDSVVWIRFESPSESDAAEIDAVIEDSYGLVTPVYDDRSNQVAEVPIALLARGFQREKEAHREQVLLEMMQGGFGAVVPPDILDLKLGDPLGADEDVGEIDRPTILVRIRLEPDRTSGGMIQVLLPPEAYGDTPDFEGVYGLPAIQFVVDLSVHLPGEAKPYETRLKIRPPADMRELHSTMAPESSGGDVMRGSGLVNRGWWLVAGGIRSALFRDGTQAHAGMRLPEDETLLRALVVAMLADGLIQQEPEAGEHADEFLQLQVMMHKMTGLVLPEEMIGREIEWVDEHMGTGGWIDRVARGRELILQPLRDLPPHVRTPIPLAVAWMGQVYQLNSDRVQGGLSDPEQLLLSNLLDAIEMSRQDYAREWNLQFRN